MTRLEADRRATLMAAHVQAAEQELVAAAVLDGALVNPTADEIARYLRASPDFVELRRLHRTALLGLEAQVEGGITH